MNDPMGELPKDHGSDRYNHVEIQGPPDIEPSGTWWAALLATPCPDCNANLFVTWIGGHSAGGFSADARVRENWHITTAHDDGCPTMAKFRSVKFPIETIIRSPDGKEVCVVTGIGTQRARYLSSLLEPDQGRWVRLDDLEGWTVEDPRNWDVDE